MRRLAVVIFVTAVPAAAQLISVGVKGGVPITDAFETFRGNEAAYATNTKRYLVGPTVQVNLPFRFAVEFDAIYKRLGYEYEQTGTAVTERTVANSWEFPLLAKFALLPGPIRPFVDAGASFHHLSGISQIRQTIISGSQSSSTEIDNPAELRKRNDVGFVFGGGVEFKLGRFRLSPEFRYTRWGSETFRDPVNALLRTSRNQGDFLIGLTF